AGVRTARRRTALPAARTGRVATAGVVAPAAAVLAAGLRCADAWRAGIRRRAAPLLLPRAVVAAGARRRAAAGDAVRGRRACSARRRRTRAHPAGAAVLPAQSRARLPARTSRHGIAVPRRRARRRPRTAGRQRAAALPGGERAGRT